MLIAGLFCAYLLAISSTLPDAPDAVLGQNVAPDFVLSDHAGNDVRLSDHRGSKVVLVFYRGHW